MVGAIRKMELYKLLEKVNSRETFLEFVEASRLDKIDEEEKEKANPSSPYSAGANGWENITIPTFLEAIHGYCEDREEIQPDWKSFALLLYAGKCYE